MAHSQDPLSKNIIDLTGTEDQDESLQILSSAAWRAEEAASRLANRFESAVLEKHRMYLAHLTPQRSPSSIVSNNVRETPATNRIPRQAAVHASHTLAEVYKVLNPLEERLQASTTTPKKLGRPRKDEWTPSSHSSRGTEESDVRRRTVMDNTISPTFHVGQGLGLNGHRKESMESPLSSKKRKFSSPSLEPGSPSKFARTAGLQVQDSVPSERDTSQTSSHEPSLQTIRNCQHVTPLNIPNSRVNAKSSCQDYYARDSEKRLAEMLEQLISPTLRNAKRRYKYTLSKDQLNSICKAVSRSPQNLNLSLSEYTNLGIGHYGGHKEHIAIFRPQLLIRS